MAAHSLAPLTSVYWQRLFSLFEEDKEFYNCKQSCMYKQADIK